jgi:hypothetical protein
MESRTARKSINDHLKRITIDGDVVTGDFHSSRGTAIASTFLRCQPTSNRAPVVLLLGWYNSDWRYLDRYWNIYRQPITEYIADPRNQDLDNDSYIFGDAPLDAVAALTGNEDMSASNMTKPRALLNYLSKNCFCEGRRPLVVHLFSNGGSILWSKMLRIAQEEAQATRAACAGAVPKQKFSFITDNLVTVIYDSTGAVVGWNRCVSTKDNLQALRGVISYIILAPLNFKSMALRLVSVLADQ